MITITENIWNVLDNNQYTWGVFLDFQKAFDTVNHRILLSKLEYYGIRDILHDLIKSYLTNKTYYTHINGVDSNTMWDMGDIPHDLIKSYLTNRKHYTHINGVDSNTLTSTHGIPQGSVLGSLLFVIYVSDMSRIIQHSEMHHSVDDKNLLYSNNSIKKINRYKNLTI